MQAMLDSRGRARSPWRGVVPLVVLVLIDLCVGWMNYHASDDVQLVALALLVAGFGFGLWRPRWAWLMVLLIWVAVPLSSILGYATNYHPGVLKPSPLYETVIALVPTAFGACVGAAVRWFSRDA